MHHPDPSIDIDHQTGSLCGRFFQSRADSGTSGESSCRHVDTRWFLGTMISRHCSTSTLLLVLPFFHLFSCFLINFFFFFFTFFKFFSFVPLLLFSSSCSCVLLLLRRSSHFSFSTLNTQRNSIGFVLLNLSVKLKGTSSSSFAYPTRPLVLSLWLWWEFRFPLLQFYSSSSSG